MQKNYIFFEDESLGSITFEPGSFEKTVFESLETPLFKQKTSLEKHDICSLNLFEEICRLEGEVFLLPKVVDYIERVRKILPTYNLASFEFWLNHQKEISEEVKLKVRGRIVGKYIPRMEYHRYFPKGEEEGSFFGPHYSLAHFSPDIDTTVASFSCFLNAFASRIGKTRHHWVIPGGPPKESVEIDLIFRKSLGNAIFSAISSKGKRLPISSLDLLTHKNLVYKKLSDLASSVDHERSKNAVVLVDDEGCYKGDWRDVDVEAVDMITGAVLKMVREHLTTFTESLVTLLSKENLSLKEVEAFIHKALERPLSEGERLKSHTLKQQDHLQIFLKEVLHISHGYRATVEAFLAELKPDLGYLALKRAILDFPKKIFSTPTTLGDSQEVFKNLAHLVSLEKEAYQQLQSFLDSLYIALTIKQKVLGLAPTFVSHLAEYDEIRAEMKHYFHLTVVYKEGEKLYPLGIIHSEDVSRKTIGSSSWNDFSNPFETDSREEVEVISIIDHHKTTLASKKAVLGILKDVQASNTIFANLAFEINDLYSTNGMSLQEIDQEIKELSQNLDASVNVRILQRLLKRKKAALTARPFYISTDRELLEYYQFIFAIFDDTDLLTKVTGADVDCMRDLINRFKSLLLKKEVEVINFDEISRSDPLYAKKAAKKILQNPDVYSLYASIYHAKEEMVDKILLETEEGHDTSFFQDTKLLSGYAEVGQFKFFAKNEPTLRRRMAHLRSLWLKRCVKKSEENPDASLFIFMLSTLSSAQELFSGVSDKNSYKDELWFWVPEENKKAAYQLTAFLEEFRSCPAMKNQDWEIEFLGKDRGYEKAFAEILQRPFVAEHSKCELSAVVVKVPQKCIKSRKSDIAVYLNAQ
ncbi:MAG: hypothetical protein JSR76_04175 [Verrucomicrobia bacterium]|nr:hypothetical protein [Verrucomicrobiota bacterium]